MCSDVTKLYIRFAAEEFWVNAIFLKKKNLEISAFYTALISNFHIDLEAKAL